MSVLFFGRVNFITLVMFYGVSSVLVAASHGVAVHCNFVGGP